MLSTDFLDRLKSMRAEFTSEMMCDYFLQTWYVQVVSRVRTYNLTKL